MVTSNPTSLSEAAATAESPRKGKMVKKTKGTRSWAPAAPLDIKSADPNFRLKWVHVDAANMMRKRAEGWVNADHGDATHNRPHGVESGKGGPSSVVEYRDMVLMKIPEEMALARAEYYEAQAQKQLHGIKQRTKNDSRNQSGVHLTGEVTIE
jgi:hypothetical protein